MRSFYDTNSLYLFLLRSSLRGFRRRNNEDDYADELRERLHHKWERNLYTREVWNDWIKLKLGGDLTRRNFYCRFTRLKIESSLHNKFQQIWQILITKLCQLLWVLEIQTEVILYSLYSLIQIKFSSCLDVSCDFCILAEIASTLQTKNFI